MNRLDLTRLPKCTVSLTGARFDQSITFEEWAEIGKRCVKVNEAVQWVIGDWANWGSSQYSEKLEERYQVAVEATGYCSKSIIELRRVSKNVDVSRRLEELSWSHHQAVSGVEDPELQAKFLRIAHKKGLSVSELRKLVRAEAAEDVKETPAGQATTSPISQLTELCLWFSHQDITSMPKAARENWKRDLKPLVEIYNRL